ncbi:MAG: hypothetical protein Q9169_005085 [Polycauliona sp. 2 TL-2023]
MSSRDNAICRLPLLDGEPDTGSQVIAVHVEPARLAILLASFHRDQAAAAALLYTAWGLVLRCYTGQDEILFETRNNSSVSLFRVAFEGNEPLSACIAKAVAGVQRAETETSEIESTNGQQRTNTAIRIQNDLAEPSSKRSKTPRIQSKNSDAEVTVSALVKSDTLELQIRAHSSNASRGYLESLTWSLEKVLQTLILSPASHVEELDYMNELHMQRVQQWTQTQGEVVDQCVHDTVREQSLRRPDHEAVCAWDVVLTYRELWDRVECLAQMLSDMGVRGDVVVPVFFEKSAWTTVAMLAVLEAGGAFCPLDATQPHARLKALTSRLGADIALCSPTFANKLSSIVERVLPVDANVFRDDNLAKPRTQGTDRATPENIAYVMWTSGSTGEPKAITIEHRAYASAAKAHAPAFFMHADTRMLQYSSYVFDAWIIETLTPLMIGATVCVPSEKSRFNELAATIVHFRTDWALLTSSVANFLDPAEVPCLKTLLLGGEPMSQENFLTWSRIRLINAYGPAESSVVAAANTELSTNRQPTMIGRGLGVRCWLVDPANHNRLLPPGCTAELVMEGPTIARGYFGDAEKTAQAFIEDPEWAKATSSSPVRRRMYKSGDLVRYHTETGMMYFVGRKDSQVKLHGQRIELGEVEHHLAQDAVIQQSMVMLPKSGPLSQRFVAVLSLQQATASYRLAQSNNLHLVDSEQQVKAQPTVDQARARLARQLPAYMIPSLWLVVNTIPVLQSGKLDRKTMSAWVADLSEEDYSRLFGNEKPEEQPTTALETRLRLLWGHVLNLKPTQIGMKQSFLSFGGDSISAMMVQSQCKKERVGITVQDILRAKSIPHLASLARNIGRTLQHVEKIEEDFDLSPIQSLYFELPNRGKDHFNQSFFVRLAHTFSPAIIRQAAKGVVNRHSMLRARFRFSNSDEEWKQRITTDVMGSYRFKEHSIASTDDATPIISTSQASIDPVKGPLFAVDVFNVDDGDQLLFMTAHHLVVDLVSWRVILQEMEDHLRDPKAMPDMESSLSFQAWSRMQIEHSHTISPSTVLPPCEIPQQNDAYWGMNDRSNVYGDAEYQGFELDAATTSLIIGKSHEALRTDTVDILVAAMIYSYARVFTDRDPATIFNEGHGREVWDEAIDLSRTIGWFTTMHPIHVPTSPSSDFVDVLKRVKDYRRSVPAKGRSYFASRMLTSKGAKKFRRHWPLELTFNYLGVYQQLEREDALLVPFEEMAGEARGAGGKADAGFDTPRFGLFEISAVIAQGKLRYSFTFNRHMKHQQRIHDWINTCQETLTSMPPMLAQMAWRPTLSDFPLLSLTYDRLTELLEIKLPSLGFTDIGNIEDMYRCSQIQQGMLISTKRDTGFYTIETLYKVNQIDGRLVDSNRIADAWQEVVNRHPSLRTIFIESPSDDKTLYDQLVLKSVRANILHLECTSDADVCDSISAQSAVDYGAPVPAHRFTICKTSKGDVFCSLEISHTIVDGTSISMMLQEMVTLYGGTHLPVTAPPYSSYLSFLQTQPDEVGLGYWKNYLAEVEPSSFPILDDAAGTRRELHTKRVEYANLNEIQMFCNLHGVTMANVFHTAWALTLQCYTGSSSVCYGYLMSTRDSAIEGIDNVVGYLVNMLVCRVSLDREDSLVSVMEQVQADLSNGQAHRHSALSEVLHTLDLGGASLFNTNLSYRKLPPAPGEKRHAISFDEWTPYYDPTEYSVGINIEVSDETAFLDLCYWTDCMSDGHASNVLNTLTQALQNIIEQPESKVGQLQTISHADHQQILEWNSDMPPLIDRCVHELVAEQRALRPSAQAVRGWDADFTYEELSSNAGKLASYLSLYGVRPEVYVSFCFEKSAYAVVAMLGILQSGGAYVALDAMSPFEGLKLRIEDTKTKIVLTSPCFRGIFEGMGLHVVAVDQSFLDSLASMKDTTSTFAQPNDPCSIVYTSGSTGKPKGVISEHGPLVTSMEAHGSAYGIGPGTRLLQFASYTFDISTQDIFTSLTRGGTVCVISEHDRMNDLAGAARKLQANWLALTPTVATYLNPFEFPTVTNLIMGGEAMTKAVLDIWGDKVNIQTCYGPSECCINSTYRGNIHRSSDPTSIGRAIGSVSWLVDPADHNNLAPIGREGELLIEGPILGRGYLNDPEKTAKAFIENPTWTLDQHRGSSRRMYKTGDLVRYNSDGTLCYLGRKDQQVKLHGQRIELGEIEYHVRIHLPTDWRFAAELIMPGAGGESSQAIAVFVCPQADGTDHTGLLPVSETLLIAFKNLEAAIAKALPKYMVPAMYVPCARLPLTNSGKLDRKQLRAMGNSITESQNAMFRLSGSTIGQEPSTETEKTLASLWESILNLAPGAVGMNAQFFRMGGDSIAAIRLVTAAKSRGITLTVADIFQNATLAEMCRSAPTEAMPEADSLTCAPEPFDLLPAGIPAEKMIEVVSDLCKVDAMDVEDIYPCTTMQEGLMALSSKQSGAYVAQIVYSLASIDVRRFKKAWNAVVAAEPILRTRIVYTEELGFLQVVVDERIEWTEMQARQEAVKDLPLYNGANLSGYAIVQESRGPFFVWTIHHAIYDGWSLDLILNKVWKCYKGSAPSKATKETSYANFIKHITGLDDNASAGFWRSMLSGTTSPQYPMLSTPTYQPHVTGTLSHAIPFIKSVGSDITMPTFIRAAWALTISAYCNSEDVVFGEAVTGRDVPIAGILDLVGPTLATVPVRVHTKRELTVSNYVKQLQELFSKTMAHQHMGLQRIKRIDADTSAACDFQNLIVLNSESSDASDDFWKLQNAGAVGNDFFTYALTVTFDIGPLQLRTTAHYDPEVIPEWHLQRLVYYFEETLIRLMAERNSSSSLADVQTIPKNDDMAIMQWNDEAPVVVDRSMHDCIAAKSKELPATAPAVHAWDAQFTHQELDTLAMSFACQLQEVGVGSQDLVPICFEKSAVPIVVMLAIFKLGASFVPIDGASPEARLKDIVSDTNARVVLCSPKYSLICGALGIKTCIVDLKAILDQPRRLMQLPACTGTDIAYVLFTSGSTGKPKGTMVPHSALCSSAIAHARAMRMKQSSRVLQFSSYTFDACIAEIFTALMMGACVCVPDDETRLDNVAKCINDMKVTWTMLTPSFVQTMSPSDVPGLETLVLVGEASSQQHYDAWADHLHLANGYGPTECTVISTVNSPILATSNPLNIGRPSGCHCFIVSQHDHNHLVPVGAIGELMILGPILARGYLNDVAKTGQAFVSSPPWASRYVSHADRAYKTGDLVRYAEDGSLIYVGRKDHQSKVRGQRLELGEVEHHLGYVPSIRHGLATIPSRGLYEKKLVGVLTFKDCDYPRTEDGELSFVARKDAEGRIQSAKDCLTSRLPPYMVPSNWIVLTSIPLMPSGKLARRQITAWVEDMSEETFRQISGTNTDNTEAPGTEVEQRLQRIWSKVLHLPPQQMGFDKNFLYLGGDSISALQVASQCRSQGLGVTVQDIIRCPSLSDLALRVTLPKQSTQFAEEYETPFDLSPIQRLFFEWVGVNYQHFNQSIVLKIKQRQDVDHVFAAVEALVKSQSVLRARFERGPAGQWVQLLTKESSSSLRCTPYPGKFSLEQMSSTIETSQKSLDIQSGPLVAVDLFESDESGFQVLSLVVHHLVVDVVSWGIILNDLEDIILSHKSPSQPPLSFQVWSRLQLEKARSDPPPRPVEVPAADYSYWNMAEQSNTYGTTSTLSFSLDEATTTDLLGRCNQSLGTELIDTLLASMLYSFCRAFPDRQSPPAVFNEGHGREPWDADLDLSQTVGWFTTITPVHLPSEAAHDGDIVNVIRWVKDQRRSTRANGRPYFAHRMLTDEGSRQSNGHWPMEIAFNYLGQEKQFSRATPLFQPFDELTSKSDIGPAVPRMALFELSAFIANDGLKVSLAYPQSIQRQDDIQHWATEMEASLRQSATLLCGLQPQPTLSSFPSLPLAYNTLSKLQERLPSIGVESMTELEDVYGCSSMQQALLLSQIKNASQYMFNTIFAVNPVGTGSRVSAERLGFAWQAVVQKHASLRTVFIESLSPGGLTDQAVLKKTPAGIEVLQADATQAVAALRNKGCITSADRQPHHRLTICETNADGVFCKLELSHAICDGTSMPIIFQDLAQAYRSQSPRVEKSLSYSDYVSYLKRTSREDDAAYWRQYLDAVEPCHFPALTDGLDEEKQLRNLELELRDVARLRSFCTQRGITLSTALQFVWSLVLRAYTGNQNVCFGYLSSGRDAPIDNIESAVGLFISMLVCRMDCSNEVQIGSALEQIRDDYTQSMSHQAFSLGDMQHELQLSGKSLFNTAFTYQRRPAQAETKDQGITFNILDAHDPSEYDLTVNVEVNAANVSVYFTYWTNFLSGDQAKNISETFDQVVSSLIATAAPERTIETIEYCSLSHQRQMVGWNRQPLPLVDRCVHEVIESNSRDLPLSTPAVCSWDGDLTYSRLIMLSTRLAHQLALLGVGPETYVPICFEKSLWAVVAMLGILQAGGAFVPLEPTHPDDRLKFIISDVSARIILTSAKYSNKFTDYPGIVTHVVAKTLEQDHALRQEPISPASTANASYLIFTSGTTGLPKGTIISHRAFTTSATEHAPAILMTPKSRVLQFSNLCFDASIMEILSSLIAGACVCIPSDEERMNDIPGAVRRMSANWTLLTPSVAEVLIPDSVPSLQVLVTGGEAMQARHIAKWSGKTSLINAYGPSETAVIATTSIKVDEQRRLVDHDPTVIGRAVGCRSWVVNPQDHTQLMPIGSVGELVVEGNTVARGYLNNAEKTAKSFVPRPAFMEQISQDALGDAKSLVYKTGDLVRYRSDGKIVYVSRKDTQIKLNGLRIELGEIEHHVKKRLPENIQTAVEMVAPAGQERTLAMFFSAVAEDGNADQGTLLQSMTDGTTSICRKLKADLAGALPAYMIPSLYVPLTRMPWTASGKLDRTHLCQIVSKLSVEETGPLKLAIGSDRRMPTTEMEKQLQKLWERILGQSATLDDSFFVVGGDSVQAMKLVAAARAEKISLSVLDIFRKPTLADMAGACSPLEGGDESVLKPFGLLTNVDSLDQLLDEMITQCRVEKHQLVDAYPCSALQEGLITLSIKQPGAYVANNVFHLPEAVDVVAFKAAWEKAIEDMDILRARIIHTTDSTFVQAVLKEEHLEWHSAERIEDVTVYPVPLPEHSGSPLMRFTLIDNGSPSDRYLVWSVHHALYDGWSMPRMLQRVEDIYFEDSPPPIQASYAQFIKYVSGIDAQVSDRFWRSKFDSLQSIHFPRVSAAEGEQQGTTDALKYTLRLPPKATATGITLPTIIRAAWAMLLSAHTGSDDVVFGETMTGRDIPVDGVIDLLGPTLTTIPTRIRLNKTSKIVDLLRDINQMAAEVIPYQHVGIQNIRRLNEETAMACDFQNLLVIQTAQTGQGGSKLWRPVDVGLGSNFFTYPLVIECNADESVIEIDATYNRHVISEWHVQRLLYQLEMILGQIYTASPDGSMKLNDVKVISHQDIESIRQWNDYEPVTSKECIHELFLQHAETIPNTPAVCAWDGDFTYGQLSKHAEKLASHLQRRYGVSPEVLVPFCMDKSRWALVAQMGVLMAGGAIIPLDPAHPVSRHAEIIKDSRASLLLCSPSYQDRYSSMVEAVVPIEEKTLARLPKIDGGSDTTLLQSESSNTAYVIFTSGSTGRPKGVVVEHQAFTSSSVAYTEAMLMTPASRVFNFASVTFDVGLMENLSPLTLGACVCIPNNEAKMTDLASAINGLKATWAFLTPSVANLIEPAAVPSLEVLVCGGEAMSKENVLKWADSLTLVNGYGPTEAAVISVVNRNTSQDKDASNIGYAHDNGFAWIGDADNHHQLAPLGCVGELLLGGPILAREYLHDEAKTQAAFIHNPDWLSTISTGPAAHPKIYKTGDLVKYNENGSITFIGRKDNQIKLHGNRIELGEIEHKFELHPHIRHTVAVVPKAGFCKKRLVAVLSLSGMCSESQASNAKECVLLQEESRIQKAQAQLKEVREFVSDRLPVYMVPTLWIAVEAIPLLVSGKLDRKQVERWIEKMDDDQYRKSTANDNETQEKAPITETVQQLREVWATVFNMPVDAIDPGRSFMSQGGDSLISMSIIAKLRKVGIIMSLQEILRSKSLFQLAAVAESRGSTLKNVKVAAVEEQMDEPFDLSPVQRLYFELAGPSCDHTREGRFNQSQLLRLTRKTDAAKVRKAIATLVQQHSMFRARFSRNQAGVWQQRLVKDVSASFRFDEHCVEHSSQMLPLLATNQTSLDIVNGPLFAIKLIETMDKGQVVSLVAHHLIIDVVSWNIILQQLEDLLTSQSETVEKPLSFQVWTEMQLTHAKQREASKIKAVLPFNIKRADMAFWGMADAANTYGDVKVERFSIDKDTTRLAFGKANDTLRTQPVELFLSTLISSFEHAFPQRAAPTIFNESHGRDAWDPSIDLTATTGWFTSISPLHLPAESQELSSVEVLQRVKDLRRSIPNNGRDYFAHRYLTPDGRWRFGDHMPMEILVNYTGKSQQSGKNDSLFSPFDIAKSEQEQYAVADVGPSTVRMALFEISVGASDDQIHFSFMYNKHMQHQGTIEQWMTECQRHLSTLVSDLCKSKAGATLIDYPLLPTTYSGLQKHLTETFAEIGIKSLDEVEDIYVTAPTQEGLLLSQIRHPEQYINYVIHHMELPQGSGTVDVPRLVRSWQKVVDRHQCLRTAFVYSVCKGHAFDQIALKQAPGGARVFQCADEGWDRELAKSSLRETNKTRRPMLPHQFAICTTGSGKCYTKLELNHAVIDGGSGSLIARDLAAAYENNLNADRPLYSEYVKYINTIGQGTGSAFWKNYLHKVERCHLPTGNHATTEEKKRLIAVYMDFKRFPELQAFCRKNEITLSNVMLAAWGLVLRHYTARDDVCFGNLTAGREAPVEGIPDAVGAFINMLVCRVDFSPTRTLKLIANQVQNDYLDMLAHQHTSLAKVQHDLGFSGQPLFNTAVSIQNQISTRDAEREGDSIKIEPVTDYDPTEYAVTVNIRSAPGDEGGRIKHWTNALSIEEGKQLTKTYEDMLGAIIDYGDQTVAEMDRPGEIKVMPDETSVQPAAAAAAPVVRNKSTPTMVEPSPPIENMEEQPRSHGLEPHAYRSLIQETVRETIEQLIKSGELIRPRPMSDATDFDADQNSAHGIDQYDFGNKKSHDGERSYAGSYTETFSYEAMSKTLRELWSPLLDIPMGKIYDDDSFFALGGDSILAMELAKSTRDAGLSLTVADIFGEPVFSDMVYCMGRADMKKQSFLAASDTSSDTEREEDDGGQMQPFSLLEATNVETFLQDYICPRVGVFRGGIVDAFPVTDFQALAVTGTMIESRWMMNYFTFDGDGNLDIGRLRKAASKLVDSLDILRTVFVPCSNRFLQVVLRTLQPQVHVYDTDLDFDVFTKQLRDSDSPRLGEAYMQMSVIRKTGSRAHRIILRLSHAQYDGVCLPKILDSLRSAYEGKDIPRALPFSAYIKEACSSPDNGSREYWSKLLQGSSMTEIVPRQQHSPQQPRYDSPNTPATILTRNIQMASLTSRNITPATILKAAWSLTLAHLSGQHDVVFGTLTSGRNTTSVPNVESLIAPCINLIPIRLRLSPTQTALSLLRTTQSQSVAGMTHESLGFRSIVQQCTTWPEWTYFSTLVQHQNLAQDFELALDRVSYKVGAQSMQDTLADMSIQSTPKRDDTQRGGAREYVEIALGFNQRGGSITREFAQMALDGMSSVAEIMARDPGMAIQDVVKGSSLPDTTTTLLHQSSLPDSITTTTTTNPHIPAPSKQQQQPLDITTPLLRAGGATKAQITLLADTLAHSWRLVLPARSSPSRQFILNLDSSFYESGGDLIALASLTSILTEQEGFSELKIEDLMSRPSMGEQVALLRGLQLKELGARSGGSSSDTLTVGESETVGGNGGDGGAVVAVPAKGEAKAKMMKVGWWRRGIKVLQSGKRKNDKDNGGAQTMSKKEKPKEVQTADEDDAVKTVTETTTTAMVAA